MAFHLVPLACGRGTNFFQGVRKRMFFFFVFGVGYEDDEFIYKFEIRGFSFIVLSVLFLFPFTS